MAFSEATKLAVKRKAHFRCCLCHGIGVEVHHIIPQEDNGPDTEDNAAALCPSCHETYGANITKRKFIREARDLWYEICEKRYAADPDRLDRIERRMVTKAELLAGFDELKSWVATFVESYTITSKDKSEIIGALTELEDRVKISLVSIGDTLHLTDELRIASVPVVAETARASDAYAVTRTCNNCSASLTPRVDGQWLCPQCEP